MFHIKTRLPFRNDKVDELRFCVVIISSIYKKILTDVTCRRVWLSVGHLGFYESSSTLYYYCSTATYQISLGIMSVRVNDSTAAISNFAPYVNVTDQVVVCSAFFLRHQCRILFAQAAFIFAWHGIVQGDVRCKIFLYFEFVCFRFYQFSAVWFSCDDWRVCGK